ncbi:MAG: hypothetical protein L6R41_007645 [Letrouitia leprolyta]|nr:MAG: hypothetical protein L6R41_007645 [Letrouitia leprolyta]
MRHQPAWLLLLSNPTKDISQDSIKANYSAILGSVLRKAAAISSSLGTITLLDVALPCPEVYESNTLRYSYMQNLLGQLYSLICLLCTEQSIDVEYGNDVDVRILLFQASSLDRPERHQEITDRSYEGPIVSLQRLAHCSRLWQGVYSIDDDNGESLLKLFLSLRESSPESNKERLTVERISTSLPHISSDQESVESYNDLNRALHKSVAVGGTFDHLHVGHKLLLSMTALVLSQAEPPGNGQNRSITVGITGDKLLEKKKFRNYLQDWHQRQAAVQTFLEAFLVEEAPSHHDSSVQIGHTELDQQRVVSSSWLSGLVIRYVEIFDAFGPTITEEKISALILSAETRTGGKAVNEKRAEKGWPMLDVFEVDVLDFSSKDASASEMDGFQNKISSTEIRRRLGERMAKAD